MKNRTNPRKIPCSKADVDKAYQRGLDDGLLRGIHLMLYTLIEKRGMDEEEAASLGKDLDYMCDSINRGYLSWDDVETMLHEYNMEVQLV